MKRLRLRVRKWWRLAGRVQLLRSLTAVWFLVRDARTPRLPKVLAWAVLAYALSPIDLIPDVIPVLGQVDDLILVPLLIWAALHLIPPGLRAELRARALRDGPGRLPTSRVGAAVIILSWLLAAGATVAILIG